MQHLYPDVNTRTTGPVSNQQRPGRGQSWVRGTQERVSLGEWAVRRGVLEEVEWGREQEVTLASLRAHRMLENV